MVYLEYLEMMEYKEMRKEVGEEDNGQLDITNQ